MVLFELHWIERCTKWNNPLISLESDSLFMGSENNFLIPISSKKSCTFILDCISKFGKIKWICCKLKEEKLLGNLKYTNILKYYFSGKEKAGLLP